MTSGRGATLKNKNYHLGGAFRIYRHFDKISNENVAKVNCHNKNMT